jgi:DNA repair exonuclease SbcCD ATPase subunit
MKWDLFNPKPEFNTKTMAHKLDVSTLDNPYIQVIWEDTAENFTQERIKSVKQYFQKKYASNNINVITKVKTTDDVQQTIDVSVNIMDKNYQRELVRSLVEAKGHVNLLDSVMNIDSAVESRMITDEVEISPFKKWYMKKIEFSNFLSYGENQVIDFEKCNGITVVESDPPNFGGKTVLSVDLLMFLFFNTTTKTQKAEEIFNRFSDSNKVSVRGEITIDGEDYIIARSIERKKNKAGEWNVKTELDFFKKLADGQLQNFTGEQRGETEKFIKNSIGNMDDFLMTILTTASNLEDLIEAKPTARGQVLSRFLGLEFLKKKEETAKEIYSEFSKGMMSNVYNTESLRQQNDTSKSEIKTLQDEMENADTQIKDVDTRLQKGQQYKDGLIGSKFTDLDQELVILNPETLKTQITTAEGGIKELERNIKSVDVVEPKEYYHEDKHDEVKEKLLNTKLDKNRAWDKVEEISDMVTKYGDGMQCQHCGIKLMEAELTKKKISELDGWKEKHKTLSDEVLKLEAKEKSFVELKNEFDKYEKNKLIKEKYEISLESAKDKKLQLEEKLGRYEKVQEKIKKNNEIDAQLVKANMRINELIDEKRGYDRIKVSNQLNIKNHNERIEKNNEIIGMIAEEFEREKVYKIYLDVFGKNGISKMIMKTMMPIINQELQRLLMDSCYFNLEIRINDKNEVEFMMIDNSTGIEKLMVSGSGYERTIASMALRAVLSKVCSLPKPNIIVWDEVFGKVSNENLDMVGEFFNKMKDYFEKIFVITHNPLVNNWANNVVKITKVDNISRITQ